MALLTETETRLTSTADALASSPPVELVIELVLVAPEPRIALAEVARELVRVEAEEPRVVPVVAGLEQWIVPAVVVVTGRVAAAVRQPIVQAAVVLTPDRPRVRAGEAVVTALVVTGHQRAAMAAEHLAVVVAAETTPEPAVAEVAIAWAAADLAVVVVAEVAEAAEVVAVVEVEGAGDERPIEEEKNHEHEIRYYELNKILPDDFRDYCFQLSRHNGASRA